MERGRGRYIAPKIPENSGSSSGFIILLVLCCCSVLVVLGIYGAAEGSDSNKTGIETLQELFEGKITLEDVFSNIEKGGDTSVPCQGSWSNWGACSEPCGGGTRSRTWTTTTEPLYGGAACPSPLTQEEACNTGACPAEPCEGSWSGWSACSAPCGGGIKTKTWTTTKEPKYGGTACPSPKIKSDDCNTQACPIDCVGEWKVSNNSCDFDCGTGVQGTYYYDIKTSAAHGGNACPHAQGDTKTASCDLPSCPTVDTTETIGGITYDVKYYDGRDGHAGYYVQRNGIYWYSPTTTIWNGEAKTSADFETGTTEPDPLIGSDGHGYLKGTEQTKIEGSTYTRYSVKRSQQPIPEKGTCTLNKATEYVMKVGGKSDYECAGKCGAKRSKGTCESTHETCDYLIDGVPSYQVSSRSRKSLAGACKWVLEGDTQEIEPDWKTKIGWSKWSMSRKKIDGTFLKKVDGHRPYYFVQNNGVPLEQTPSKAQSRTEKLCIEQCFSDPECTGFNEVYPKNGEYRCDLYTGDVDFGGDGRGWKITRNYE